MPNWAAKFLVDAELLLDELGGFELASVTLAMPARHRALPRVHASAVRPEAVSEVFADPIQQVRVCFGDPTWRDGDRAGRAAVGRQPGEYRDRQPAGRCHLCYGSTTSTQRSNDFAQSAACRWRDRSPAVAFGGRRIVFPHDLNEI